MKRKNVFILLLVFLILLTPSCVLFVKAIATSPFPEREKIEEVSIRLDESGGKKANGVNPFVRGGDSREVDLLYAIFAGSKRVWRSSLPDESAYAAYRVSFKGERFSEDLTLYVGGADFTIYVLTSGKKLYSFRMPTVSHKSVLFAPSAASFSLDGEKVVIYDYPGTVDGPTDVNDIGISNWQTVTRLTFSDEVVSVHYEMYSARAELIGETDDPEEIVRQAPDSVAMDVTADLSAGITVTLRYLISVLK